MHPIDRNHFTGGLRRTGSILLAVIFVLAGCAGSGDVEKARQEQAQSKAKMRTELQQERELTASMAKESAAQRASSEKLAKALGGTTGAANFITFIDKTGNSGGSVCMIGHSLYKAPDPPGWPQSTPAYVLQAGTTGASFVQITAAQKNNTSIPATDIATVPYPINGAIVDFYVLNTSTAPYSQCSDLQYSIDTSGNVTYTLKNSQPFPNSAIFEITRDPGTGAIHADTSNVNNFNVPIQLAFYQDAAPTLLGVVGQPADPEGHVNRAAILDGYAPWIASQPDPNKIGISNFSNLLDSKGTLGGGIIAPYFYVLGKGTSPSGIPNASLHLSDPLNQFFDAELNTLFSTKNLRVKGDASGSILQQYYTVTSVTCPWTATTQPAAQFTGDDGTTKFTICNPVGITVYSIGGTAITATGSAPWTTWTITPAPPQSMVGWTFIQPDTGFSGTVQSISGNTVTLSNTKNAPNPSYTTWGFTNWKLPSSNPLNQAETSGAMVFGADGVFVGTNFHPPGDLATVYSSVARNINEALLRGVANCNNITMKSPQGVCKTMTGGTDTATVWGTESNWYPSGAVQNYYAQFLHTYQVGHDKKKINISVPPNNQFAQECPAASSKQGITMGMIYGFSFDENPVYMPGCVANVPSKWDPAPPTTTSLTITLGPLHKLSPL